MAKRVCPYKGFFCRKPWPAMQYIGKDKLITYKINIFHNRYPPQMDFAVQDSDFFMIIYEHSVQR